MKVGLIQVDGKMPNLALMKLARWHREKGDEVRVFDLSSFGIEQWYGSKIFMGGSGYELAEKLPDDIECQVPDYESFRADYSMIFTTRGCVRNCGFCIVKAKEGELREVDWQKDLKHSKVIVMDNNFFASPIWKEKLEYFIRNKIKVNFNQGLDLRFMDDEKCAYLARVKYCDKHFNKNRLYFAFDNPHEYELIKAKLELVLRHIPAIRIMVYMLVGYNTTFAEDMFRFEFINSYGCDPYVMLYGRGDLNLRNFARWVNKRLYRTVPWAEYKR